MVTKEDLIADIKKIGVNEGDIVNLKASLKSIGKVEGGPLTLIEALRAVVGPNGAIVTEAFIKMKPLIFLNKKNPTHISGKDSFSYAGAVTNAILNHPDVILGEHPTHRYAGIGKRMEKIIRSHNVKDDPYLVLEEMALMGARNLRIGSKDKVVGVGTTHIAVNKSNYRQKRPQVGIYYRNGKGELELFKNWWATGCEKSFNNIIDLFEGTKAIVGKSKIGNSEALLTDMNTTFKIELAAISKDPTLLLCGDKGCSKCYAAWDFSKKSAFPCLYNNIINLNAKGILSSLFYTFSTNYLPLKK